MHSFSIDCSRSRVILDGPAFAYTIYGRLIAGKADYLGPLAAVPSYDEVGKAALAFLGELEKCGVVIDKIYFDGYLPTTKTPTRLLRLESQVQKLSAFHTIHRNGVPNGRREDRCVRPSSTGRSTYSRSAVKRLPDAPFFVAAIIEALGDSKYAGVTSVVPGEADAYCAEIARSSGGIIFTNDSDLLIYDLGPNGAVGSLYDLEFIDVGVDDRDGNNSGEHCLVQTKVISPSNVAKALSLPNLHKLAYVLTTSTPPSLREAVDLTKDLATNDFQLTDFVKEYTNSLTALKTQYIHPGTPHQLKLTRDRGLFLDPRISELVFQSRLDSPSIYLPFLIEDPSRTTAWAVSSLLRILAYSCCLLPQGLTGKVVKEYSRKGQKVHPTIIPTSIDLLSESAILNAAMILRKRLRQFKTAFSAFPVLLWCRVYALAEVYHWYLNTDRPPPSRETMVTVITGKLINTGMLKWGEIHLIAQIEATLYSLRIVFQTLEFIDPMTVNNTKQDGLIEALTSLKDELRSLPPLKDLMPSLAELVHRTKGIEINELLDLLAGVLQADLVDVYDHEVDEEKSDSTKCSGRPSATGSNVVKKPISKKRRKRNSEI